MSKKTLTEIKLTQEGLKDILIKHFNLPESTVMSFDISEVTKLSRYDDIRDRPSYIHVLNNVILKTEESND